MCFVLGYDRFTITAMDRSLPSLCAETDFNQLLDDNGDVCVRWIKNQELVNFTHLDLHDSYGLYPSQFADYLALAGDKSDNVEGVQGIGPKRAIQLLKQYGTLEGVFKALERHRESGEAFIPKSAIGPLSQDGAYEQAIKCRKLCSLVTDASEVSQSIQSLAWDPAECNSEECQALLFDELSFESLREPMNALKQGKPLPQSI
jgi:5'-3' exonuclease